MLVDGAWIYSKESTEKHRLLGTAGLAPRLGETQSDLQRENVPQNSTARTSCAAPRLFPRKTASSPNQTPNNANLRNVNKTEQEKAAFGNLGEQGRSSPAEGTVGLAEDQPAICLLQWGKHVANL